MKLRRQNKTKNIYASNQVLFWFLTTRSLIKGKIMNPSSSSSSSSSSWSWSSSWWSSSSSSSSSWWWWWWWWWWGSSSSSSCSPYLSRTTICRHCSRESKWSGSAEDRVVSPGRRTFRRCRSREWRGWWTRWASIGTSGRCSPGPRWRRTRSLNGSRSACIPSEPRRFSFPFVRQLPAKFEIE